MSVSNIAGALAASPNQGTWVITSYAVAEAVVVPLTGWLSARFGAVKVFVLRHGRLRHLLVPLRPGALA
jgi:DHA2 family multidrug resistance protein